MGFWSAKTVSNNLVPNLAGQAETFLVPGLDPAKTWFFAIATYDSANNISEISNVAWNRPPLTSLVLTAAKDTIEVFLKTTLTAHAVYLPRPRIEIKGPKGVQASFDWQAALATSPARMCTAVLVNNIGTY